MTPREKETGNDDQPGLSDLISITQAAEISGLSSRQWRKLAETGQIWAVKLGRNWFTTAQTVTLYLSQIRRPGPKPKKKTDNP